MLTAGLITLGLCLVFVFVIVYLVEERNLSEEVCVALALSFFLAFMFGVIWVYSGSYDKGYERGAIDMMKGKVKFESTTEYKILKKQ